MSWIQIPSFATSNLLSRRRVVMEIWSNPERTRWTRYTATNREVCGFAPRPRYLTILAVVWLPCVRAAADTKAERRLADHHRDHP